jgi:hypothetical protein
MDTPTLAVMSVWPRPTRRASENGGAHWCEGQRRDARK